MALKKKTLFKKFEKNNDALVDDSKSDEIVDESYRMTSLRNFVSAIGMNWKKLNRRQLDKISRTKQYRDWAGFNKIKNAEKNDPNLQELHRPFSLHRVHRPHMRPTEKPKLDVGQIKKTIPGRQPETTYTKIARNVINKGGEVRRSAGAITYAGRKGKYAYKATQHAQLKVGGSKMTIKPHKGVSVHGRLAQKLSVFGTKPLFTKKRFSVHNESIDDLFSESSIKSREAHHNLLGNGFIITREGKHRNYEHPTKKIKVSLSRTGDLTPGQTQAYKKAMKLSTLSETEDSLDIEDSEEKIIPLKISKKTENLLKKSKSLKSSKDDKDLKIDPNTSNLKFQYDKTLTGTNNSGKEASTDVIEINPEMNPKLNIKDVSKSK